MEGEGDEEDDPLNLDTRINTRDGFTAYCGFSKIELLFTVVVTLLSIGVNFAIDIPASLQDSLSESYDLSQYKFSLFYTSYFLPSLLINPFGGYLIDKVMGVRKSAIVYGIVAILGTILFVLGGVVHKFWLMILGRLLFGLGNEMATGVCVSYCTFTYFNKSSVNFLFSLTDNMSYLGTMAIFQLAPYLFMIFNKTTSSYQSLEFVFLICSSSYLITAALGVWITYIKPPDDDLSLDLPDGQTNQITIQDVLKFPPTFWLLCFTFYCFTSANYTFETFSQGLLTSDLYNLTEEEASNAITIMNGVKIILSVPLSLFVDKFGRNLAFTIISMILCTISYLLLLMRIHPYITMGFIGISYSFTGSSIWAMFAHPINRHLRGSCYGIVSASSGLSQTICPSIVGKLIDRFGYTYANYFYLAHSAVGLFSIVFTWILDFRADGILMMTPQQRIERDNIVDRMESEQVLITEDWNAAFED